MNADDGRKYIVDKSGINHYVYNGLGDDVMEAAADLLEKESLPAVWFWFKGIPAPVFSGDCKHSLATRWIAWREAYTSKIPARLLACFDDMLFKN